jgi:pyrophosphatase PpaX
MNPAPGRSYAGVLFDLDGTLVDSLELILSSYRHTIKVHLGREIPDEEWMRTMGMPLRIQLRYFTDSPQTLDAMFQTYVEHNQRNHDRLLRPFPGMREVVAALRDAGYRMGVVTSKIREHAWRELRAFGMDGYFDGMVSADDVAKPKPDPEPVLIALETLKLAAGETLFVGDSLFDLQAGRAAAVHTAAALWGPFRRERLVEGRPDHWLEDVAALARLLGVDPEGQDG